MSETVHVLCTQSLTDRQLAQLKAVSPRLEITHHSIMSSDELEQHWTPQTEVIYTHESDFDPGQAPGLKWIQIMSAGVNHLHGTKIWESDVTLTSANGVHSVQIAEYVLATLLAFGHRLPQMQRLQVRRAWPHGDDREALMPVELRDATLGIVGYGAIGREVARLAAAFGMRILATQRKSGATRFRGWTLPGTGDPDGSLPERYYLLDDLSAMLKESDAVLLALPLTDQTRHLLGSTQLAAMRSSAVLINVGRGAVVDQGALIEALATGQIGGALLDVTDPEPLPAESPLWTMENVIITPHISGMSRHYDDRAVALFVENLRRYLAGEPLFNIVRRDQGY